MLPSRPSTRAYFRAAVGKTSGSASALGLKDPNSQGTGPIFVNEFVLQSTTAAPTVDGRAVPASTASALAAADGSSDAASSKAPSAQPGAWAGKGAELHGTTPARLSAVATAQKWLMNAEVASECVEHRYA